MAEQPAVLVVDDNALVRRMLAKALEGEGYAVASAGNGLEALSQVKQQAFEVVVSDMDMPKMDGLTLIAEVKEIDADLPIVVVSGNDQLDVVIEAMKRGASDYIIKDEDAQTTVVLAVQKALEKRRLAVQNRQLTEELQQRNQELEQLNQENVRLVHRLTRFNEDLEEKVAEATEEIRARLTETRALNRVAAAISSVMDVEPLLALIAEAAQEVTGATVTVLRLVDPESGALVAPLTEGQELAGIEPARLEVGRGIAGWVAQSGEPLRIDDAYNDPRFDPALDAARPVRTGSVMCVPLKIQDEVRGVLTVANTRDQKVFQQDDLQTLVAFSHHAAIAIENARLYEETKQKSEELRRSLERERWLQVQRDKLGKYVPKSVVQEIERDREQALAATTRTVECTILFADIEGFTRMAETADPFTLVRMLNQYHSALCDQIERHDGVLDKFMGDGTMAIFLPAEGLEDHPLRAVRCAMAMQHAVAELAPRWQQAGLGNLRVRIGVNTGEVISGSIGSATRMDYTVVGDTVNVASRLETNGLVGRVLISETVHERVKEHVRSKKLKPLHVKNRAQPVQTYSIPVLPSGNASPTAPESAADAEPELPPASRKAAQVEVPLEHQAPPRRLD